MKMFKKTKVSIAWDNCLIIDAEGLMILIEQSLSAGNDDEENDSSFSVKDFLQSNGGSSGLMGIKKAIEAMGTSSRPVLDKHHCFSDSETSHSLSCTLEILLSTRQDSVESCNPEDSQKCNLQCAKTHEEVLFCRNQSTNFHPISEGIATKQ